jgi:hypothetical protein|tara:strand:- start:34 stop:192 length:159 start_codon:yes stop_codon:yes gene_type:complete
MNLLKKLWNFLFGSKEEKPVVLEKPAATVQHCGSHLRFKKSCAYCQKAIALI